MKKLVSRFRENAIPRFMVSYIVVMILTLLICQIVFSRAIAIVKDGIVEKNVEFMHQSIDQIDNRLTKIYAGGVELSLSGDLKSLGRMTGTASDGYYDAAMGLIGECGAITKYVDSTYLAPSIFIYLNELDRVVFDSAFWTKELYQNCGGALDIALEEWYGLCAGDDATPFLYASSEKELFWVFPCFQSLNAQSRYGTIFWEIQEEKLLEYMGFLESYDGYSLFCYLDKECVLAWDGLGAGEPAAEYTAAGGVYSAGSYLIVTISSESYDLTYSLVILDNEISRQLNGLRIFISLMIFLVIALGSGIAWVFSVRTGRPINQIADALTAGQIGVIGMGLNEIENTVRELVREQKENLSVLQKGFFHNLLKADFVSRAEIEYMASRAQIRLPGDTCYAAAIRYFPKDDVELIDGETLDKVRAVQVLVEERMREICEGQIWFYSRNTLETLCIVERSDEEWLLETLADTAIWLKNSCHVDACWGVGSPCSDLVYFWKSAEEACAAVEGSDGHVVSLYSRMIKEWDNYLIPDSMLEHFRRGLQAGNLAEAQKILGMICQDNFKSRSIRHSQFIRLNRDIGDILAEEMSFLPDREEKLAALSAIVTEQRAYREYFAYAGELSRLVCEHNGKQKATVRSEKIAAISGYLRENYSDAGLSLSLVSEKFKISEGYLSVIFKEEMGINFGDYLERIRIEAACEMLKEGMLIAVVAEQSGYNSVQSFRRAFKRVMNIRPSEYRL